MKSEGSDGQFPLIVRTIGSLPPSAGATLVVGIDGCGGAGKSTFAARLAEEVGGVDIVHTDDFASWDNTLNWWPRLLEQVLEPLARGEVARYQKFDWELNQLSDWREVRQPVVIVEGVSACRVEFRPFLGLKVFIDCPRDERLRRGLLRDGPGAEPQWLRWMSDEDRYMQVHHPDEVAEFIVNGSRATE